MKRNKIKFKLPRKKLEKAFKMTRNIQIVFILLLIWFLVRPPTEILASKPFYTLSIVIFIIGILSAEWQKKHMIKQLEKK